MLHIYPFMLLTWLIILYFTMVQKEEKQSGQTDTGEEIGSLLTQY